MPGVETNNEDFATFGKDHALSKTDHREARHSTAITSEMVPFCFNPRESEEYFRFLSYDICMSTSIFKERTLYLYLYKKEAHVEAFKAQTRDYQSELAEYNQRVAEYRKHPVEWKEEEAYIEAYIESLKPTAPLPLEEDHIRYVVKNSAKEWVQGKTNIGLNGIPSNLYKNEAQVEEVKAQAHDYKSEFSVDEQIAKYRKQLLELKDNEAYLKPYLEAQIESLKSTAPLPLEEDHGLNMPGKMSIQRLEKYFSDFKVRILKEALQADRAPAYTNTYEGIPIETQTQWSEERYQLVANGPRTAWKLVTIPEGSVGLTLNHGKRQFIGPGDHIFIVSERALIFLGTEKLDKMHFANGKRHVVRVLPSEIVFVQSYIMGADDYRLLMPGIHVFDLEDATILPVNEPYGQDITVTLEGGRRRFLFAKTAQGKGGVLRDNPDRLVMLPPGVTQISPIAQFWGRISTKNCLLPITIKDVKDKNGLPVNIKARINYRLVQPYFSILEFGMDYAEVIKQEAIKELSHQIKTLTSIQDPVANKADYSFYEGGMTGAVLDSLNKRLIRQTEALIQGVIQDLTVMLGEEGTVSLICWFDGILDTTIVSRLKRILNLYDFVSRSSLRYFGQAQAGKIYLSAYPPQYYIQGMVGPAPIPPEIDLRYLEHRLREPSFIPKDLESYDSTSLAKFLSFERDILAMALKAGHIRKEAFNNKKANELIDGLKALEPTVQNVSFFSNPVIDKRFKDLVLKHVRAAIVDLSKPLTSGAVKSSFMKLNNGILDIEVIKRLNSKLIEGPITRDVVLYLIDELKRAKVKVHTLVSKVSILSIKPSDPSVINQLEEATAQAITNYTNQNSKAQLLENQKMELVLKAQQAEIERLEKECEDLSRERTALEANTSNEVSRMLKSTPGASEIFATLLSQSKETFFYTPESDLKLGQGGNSFQLSSLT